ncbi:MAG: hypothetical protein K6A65_03000 [Succinivibrionaceae bacterium]|nr:hypothetical protein [Succinivibrionaceae bacterium]
MFRKADWQVVAGWQGRYWALCLGGVTLSKTFRPEGWLLRPALDLELIPAAGDTHVRSKLVATSAELSGKSDVIDSLSYSASAGLDAEMGNFGLGLGYGFTGSRHAKDHSVYLNARYTF